MKNPFLSSETLMEKMGKHRSKTPQKNSIPQQQKPSFLKTNSLKSYEDQPHSKYQPSNYTSSQQTKYNLDEQTTLHKYNPNTLKTTKFTQSKPFAKVIPTLRLQQNNYQSNTDIFKQQKSTFSNKFQDISLNIPLSPIHSKRTEDNSILPLNDSLLMQCLAKTQTRDELCRLLKMEQGQPTDAVVATFRDRQYQNCSEQPFNRKVESFRKPQPQKLQPVYFQGPVRQGQQSNYLQSNNHKYQQDEFDFEQFKKQQLEMDSILQNNLPKVMKYQPMQIVEKTPQTLYQTLPRFNHQIKFNCKVNLAQKINKQMQPLYQKDTLKVFLTLSDKITMRRMTLSE